MDTTIRIKMITTLVGTTNIDSDGRTVWINRNCQCLARFCPVSREYNMHWRKPQVIRHRGAEPTLDDWESFVAVIDESFEIKIGPEHRPFYIQEPTK